MTHVATTTLTSVVQLVKNVSRDSTRPRTPSRRSPASESTMQDDDANREERDCPPHYSEEERWLGAEVEVDNTGLVRALYAKRDGVAAAEAERRETRLRTAILHRVKKCRQNARAAGADRVAQRDRAAVDVHAIPVPAQPLAVGECLRRERFIRLDEIVVARSSCRSSS